MVPKLAVNLIEEALDFVVGHPGLGQQHPDRLPIMEVAAAHGYTVGAAALFIDHNSVSLFLEGEAELT